MVALCQLPDSTVASVSKEYDLIETAVRRWVHQAEVDAGVKPGVTTAETEELARLRKQPRDVLARGSGFLRLYGDPDDAHRNPPAESSGPRSAKSQSAMVPKPHRPARIPPLSRRNARPFGFVERPICYWTGTAGG
jgi:transposase